MLSSTYANYSQESEAVNRLFEQLSISLDSKLIRHKNGTSKPKLKRLLKIKYSSSSYSNSGGFCSRCKKEALLNTKHDQNNIQEKEVEVKKENLQCQKKVYFANFPCFDKGKDEASNKTDALIQDGDDNSKDINQLSESVPTFQTVFFAHRPSIIGNNEFWLPQYSCKEETVPAAVVDSAECAPSTFPEEAIELSEDDSATISKSDAVEPKNATKTIVDFNDQLQNEKLNNFFKNLFQQTTKHVKVLKILELINGTICTLTEEHFFQCQSDNTSFRIVDAIALKDVRRILVSDTCLMMVLEICRASSLSEFKEFVPGNPEKTESFISIMVFALSRIKNFLPDVTRLPVQLLPTCESIETWLVRQNEEVLYAGVITTENISYLDYELLDENFMVKTNKNAQFHPVRLVLRSGYLSTVCNGGCDSDDCKYTLSIELKNDITRIKRENQPWPNCIRISTENSGHVTLSSSSRASVDDLLEKLYFVIQFKSDQNTSQQHAWAFVTEFYLQFFSMTREKDLLMGFPLLNLDIKDQADCSCIIDSQGIEAEDADILPLQNRWKLTFTSSSEKMRFLTATSIQLV